MHSTRGARLPSSVSANKHSYHSTYLGQREALSHHRLTFDQNAEPSPHRTGCNPRVHCSTANNSGMHIFTEAFPAPVPATRRAPLSCLRMAPSPCKSARCWQQSPVLSWSSYKRPRLQGEAAVMHRMGGSSAEACLANSLRFAQR